MAVPFKDAVELQSQDDASPLHRAVLDESIDELNQLLEAGADVDTRDRDGGTPLHWAAANNSPQAVERLIEAGAETDVRDGSDSTPLHWAASYGSTEAVNSLLEAGANPNARDEQRRTALHQAPWARSAETLQRLIEAEADVKAQDIDGRTALHLAAHSGSPQAVELLLKAGADPDARDHDGDTPLFEAAHAGSTESVERLIEGGADPDIRGADGRSPLHGAASLNAPDAADRLIVAGANVNARDNQGVTPLHYAASSWTADTVERLLAAGADPNLRDKDRAGTPLHLAVENDRVEMVKRLLKAGMDPNSLDSEKETLLHEAARNGSPRMVETLLAAGADPRARDNQGRTALHWASGLRERRMRQGHGSEDRIETLERLIKAGSPVNARDDQGRTALHVAATAGAPDTARRLLEAGANADARDERGMTALEYGTELEPGSDEFSKVFEEHQARQEQKQESARVEDQEPIDESTMESRPAPGQEQEPLEQAATPQRAVDLNAVDEHGDTALHRAAERGSVIRVHQLIRDGAHLEARNEEGSTPLIVAVRNEEQEAVDRLLEGGAALDARDSIGNTSLHYAAGACNPDLTARLLEAHASPHLRNDEGATPIHAVTARSTHIEPGEDSIQTVDRLIEAGADLNAQDRAGNTALHFLADGRIEGARRLTEALLERGARTDLPDVEGRTPADIASAERSGVKGFSARVVKEVFEQHQARQEQKQESAQGQDQEPTGKSTTITQPEPQQERTPVERQETAETARSPAQQAPAQQPAPSPEKNAPPKRRWWRRRSTSSSRQGSEDKAQRSKGSGREFAGNACERLIKQLERGVAPWQKPWKSPAGATEPPRNHLSGNRYQGLNAIVLRAEAEERGFSDPRWMTFNQARQNKTPVRKGQRGTKVEYWKFPPPEQERGKDASPAGDSDSEKKQRRIIHRTYTVFNAQQCENMPPLEHSPAKPGWEVSERAERLLRESGAEIVHVHGDRAFYHPKHDQIVLPKQEQFPTHEAYYSTALHEMGHWTGHSERLDRETLREAGNPDTGGYGSEAYAKEELRAEMTSMTVNSVMKLPHDPERHASYVDSWIKVLKEDPNELRRAVRDAGNASEYLLQYDRERPREAAAPSRGAEVSSPAPERSPSVEKEPLKQVEREQEVTVER